MFFKVARNQQTMKGEVLICTSKSDYSHFFTGYRLFKLVLFLVGFLVVFFFTYVLCQEYLTEKLSGKSYEYGHQVYWQIYLDQFSYLSRSSRSLCIYFTIFYPSYPPWAPDIQPSSPVISVFYRCSWWFHECLFRSLSVLQFCFSVCLCVVVFLFFFLRLPLVLRC